MDSWCAGECWPDTGAGSLERKPIGKMALGFEEGHAWFIPPLGYWVQLQPDGPRILRFGLSVSPDHMGFPDLFCFFSLSESQS